MDFFFLLPSKRYTLFEKFPVRKSCPRVCLCWRNSSPVSPGQGWHWPLQWRTILDSGHHFTSPPHAAQWQSFISQADSTCLPTVHSVTVPCITCQDKWAVLCVKYCQLPNKHSSNLYDTIFYLNCGKHFLIGRSKRNCLAKIAFHIHIALRHFVGNPLISSNQPHQNTAFHLFNIWFVIYELSAVHLSFFNLRKTLRNEQCPSSEKESKLCIKDGKLHILRLKII